MFDRLKLRTQHMGWVGEVGWGLLVWSLLIVHLSHSGRKLSVALGCEHHLHGGVEVQLAAVHVLFVGVWSPTVFSCVGRGGMFNRRVHTWHAGAGGGMGQGVYDAGRAWRGAPPD